MVDVGVDVRFSDALADDGSGGATYAEMMQTNAQRIAKALAG